MNIFILFSFLGKGTGKDTISAITYQATTVCYYDLLHLIYCTCSLASSVIWLTFYFHNQSKIKFHKFRMTIKKQVLISYQSYRYVKTSKKIIQNCEPDQKEQSLQRKQN